MQCRICFDEGSSLTLTSPCLCRGTSKFIHRTCLEQYIQYYPDRMCRVCHSPFHSILSLRDIASAVCSLLVLGGLLIVSTMGVGVKIVLGGLAMGVVGLCLGYAVLEPSSLMGMSILILLFLPNVHPVAVTIWIMGFGSIAIVTTLVRRIPPEIVLKIVLAIALSAYGVFILLLASMMMDAPAFTVTVCVLFLAWYGWIQRDVRLRLE